MSRREELSRQIATSALIDGVRGAVSKAIKYSGVLRKAFPGADEGASVTKRLLWLLERVEAGGKQVHDANIVATMLESGVDHILTHNVKDFARFEGYVTVLPLVAEE
jgi:hypothetical protein